jgi:hypothetical protein
MLQSDLFIGASSGFAAMANFSEVPYFITRMTSGACKTYDIEFGAPRLPFGNDRQLLVYEPETRELLMRLLEQGLSGAPPRAGAPVPAIDPAIDVRSWEWERSRLLYAGATTYRFFSDAAFADKETAFLVWPQVKAALALRRRGVTGRAWAILSRIEANFPRLCRRFPEFLRLRIALAAAQNDARTLDCCRADLAQLLTLERQQAAPARTAKRFLARGYPAAMRAKAIARLLREYWRHKHRIPRKLLGITRQLTVRALGNR